LSFFFHSLQAFIKIFSIADFSYNSESSFEDIQTIITTLETVTTGLLCNFVFDYTTGKRTAFNKKIPDNNSTTEEEIIPKQNGKIHGKKYNQADHNLLKTFNHKDMVSIRFRNHSLGNNEAEVIRQ